MTLLGYRITIPAAIFPLSTFLKGCGKTPLSLTGDIRALLSTCLRHDDINSLNSMALTEVSKRSQSERHYIYETSRIV